MDPQIRELVQLKLNCLAKLPDFRMSENAALMLHTYFKTSMARAQDGGETRFYKDGSTTRACFLTWNESAEIAWCGEDVINSLALYDHSDQRAFTWLQEEIAASKSIMDERFILNLDFACLSLKEALFKCGLKTVSIVLQGSVTRALKSLEHVAQDGFSSAGLSLKPMKSTDEVDRVIDLTLEYFRVYPEYGWYFRNPLFVQRVREAMVRDLADDPVHYLVLSKKEAVGYFGARIKRADPLWADLAVPAFVFSPLMQGRGLLKVAYKIMLTELDKRGVHLYRGITSQEPVMHRSSRMGRYPTELVFRPRGWLSDEHFEAAIKIS